MINLGFNSGKNMPNVYLELTPVDRVLEAAGVLLTTAAWVLALIFYVGSPLASSRFFIVPGVMLAFTLIFLWASRAPIRFYSFPVKLNEQNYVMQYFIATRFTRTVNATGNLLLLSGLFIELEPLLHVPHGTFSTVMHVFAGLFFASFIVYYIFAFRYR